MNQKKIYQGSEKSENSIVSLQWNRFLEGENSGLIALYKQILPTLIFTAYSILEDEEKSKDVVADVFHKVLEMGIAERKKKLTIVSSDHTTFFNVIVKNRSINLLKIEKNRNSILKNLGSVIPFNNIDKDLIETDIEKMLEVLPKRQKMILELSLQGYKNEDISKELAISVNTVKNTLVTSRKKIKSIYRIFMN